MPAAYCLSGWFNEYTAFFKDMEVLLSHRKTDSDDLNYYYSNTL